MNGKRGKNRQTHLNKCIFMTDFPHRFFHGRRPGKDSLKFEEKSKSAADGWWSPPSLWTQEKNAGQAQDDADDLPGQQNVFIKQDAYTCQKERHADIGQE